MAMRIWYQTMSPLNRLDSYTEFVANHARMILSADTEIFFNGASEKYYRDRLPADVFRYPYTKFAVQKEAVDFCFRAEREGFDAVVLGSFSEPFLRESRSLVDIPVVSLAESAMLVGCSIAEEIALVTLTPEYARRLRDTVRRHKLESRVTQVIGLGEDISEHDVNRGIEEPDHIVNAFRSVAGAAMDRGADLLIPAEGILSLVLHKHEIAGIEGTSVMDSVATVLRYAEMLVELRRRTGLSVGRRWSYPQPGPDLRDDIRRLM